MNRAFFNKRGDAVQLGGQIGKGGEGSVWELTTNSSQVAKVYHRIPNLEKQEKLAFMASAVDGQLGKCSTWPLETLHQQRGGPVVGFLMPNVADRRPIHMLYSPAHRREVFPSSGWDFLILVARNTAAAFANIHEHRHVVADVNQGNILVGADAKVVLIDCDSFQIEQGGRTHLCAVGVPHFTPPELQSIKSFAGIKRDANHDNFGLALVIFHLLFGGRHPFSGVPLRKEVGESLEADIRAFRFAYSRDSKARGISPPPNSVPISSVGTSIAEMFETAFTERGPAVGRPTALSWVSQLDRLRSGLRRCGNSAAHVVAEHLSDCPWCELETRGVYYFLDLGTQGGGRGSGFLLAAVQTMIERIPPPPEVALPKEPVTGVAPNPLPSHVPGREGRVFARFLVVVTSVGAWSMAPSAWFLVCIVGFFAWNLAGAVGETKRSEERNKRQAALKQASSEFDVLWTRLVADGGPGVFSARRTQLLQFCDEFAKLPASEASALANLHSTAEQRHRKRFLERFFVESAEIPGVGPARSATLRSFGIETAADIEIQRVRRVPGFGEVLTAALVNWRRECERRFNFDPKRAVTEAERSAERARFASRRRALEDVLSKGHSELLELARRAEAQSRALSPAVAAAYKKILQARADLSLL